MEGSGFFRDTANLLQSFRCGHSLHLLLYTGAFDFLHLQAVSMALSVFYFDNRPAQSAIWRSHFG